MLELSYAEPISHWLSAALGRAGRCKFPGTFGSLALQQRGRAGGQGGPPGEREGTGYGQGKSTDARHPPPVPLAPINGVEGSRIWAGHLHYLLDGTGGGRGILNAPCRMEESLLGMKSFLIFQPPFSTPPVPQETYHLSHSLLAEGSRSVDRWTGGLALRAPMLSTLEPRAT